MKFHSLRLPAALACLLLALALCACGQTQETPPAPSGVGSADQEDTTPSEGMTATASQDYRVTPGEDGTYTVTLDGFIISDNLECLSYENINSGYSYSDHDPVYLKFKLK